MSSATRRRCCWTLRGPAVIPPHDLHARHQDFCKIWATPSSRTGHRLSVSEPRPPSASSRRTTIATSSLPHKELVGTSRREGRRDHAKSAGPPIPIFEDLLNVGFSTVSFDLDQQPIRRALRRPARAFRAVARDARWPSQRRRDRKFEKTSREAMLRDVKRCIDTAGASLGLHPVTSCEIPPKSTRKIVNWFNGRRARLRPLRPDLLMGGPEHGPPYPPARRAPRGTRGAPR